MEQRELWNVVFKVKPVPWHPQYSEWQYGCLQIWILGESPEDAVERASAVAGQLPYELLNDSTDVFLCAGPIRGIETKYYEAMQLGISMRLEALETAVEEIESVSEQQGV